jgi:hypothetical protein
MHLSKAVPASATSYWRFDAKPAERGTRFEPAFRYKPSGTVAEAGLFAVALAKEGTAFERRAI